MCGIVGYIGKGIAAEYLLDGLETLEYRGYDSAGIVTLDAAGAPTTTKVVGRVQHLRDKATGQHNSASLGIGHTRWATHGTVTKKNAHPHHDEKNEFYVVHNGIIENHQEIREMLEKNGYNFHSDTDTEVVPLLIAYQYSIVKDVKKAFVAAVQQLRGAYAIVMTTAHDTSSLYAAKLSSPLAIGVCDDALLIGSDALPLVSRTQQVVFMEDNEIAIVSSSGYTLHDLTTFSPIARESQLIDPEDTSVTLGEYPDFMNKEIHEAPATVRNALLGRIKAAENIVKLGGLESVEEQLRYIDRIVIIACGTSYYAGLVGEYLLEEIADIPVEVQQASEFRYRNEPLSRSTAVLVISQSGETADTIAALKKLLGSGVLQLGIVNAPGSTLARMTDAGIYCHAGVEKAVASTKAFIAQVTVLVLLSLSLSKNYPHFSTLLAELDALPSKIETLLKTESNIMRLAEKYAHHRDFLYIGRRYAFPVALEGALKLKEISYIHAEGFAGGEMKHGPLALIDESFPTFAIALSNDLASKTASNLQEIHSRNGKLIVVVDDNTSEAAQLADDTILLPKVAEPLQPILAAIATHLFAYHVAKSLGRDIDKPRNLAKSVTVE